MEERCEILCLLTALLTTAASALSRTRGPKSFQPLHSLMHLNFRAVLKAGDMPLWYAFKWVNYPKSHRQ